ncbi:MAG TPA: hypothetical protein DCG18_00200 [Richelia sp.]|nr:hypothetical protein [Richelia sp.]
MNQSIKIDSEVFNIRLQQIASAIDETAENCQGDAITLLALLRKLENLHREICDNAFQSSLPNNRQALYTFLKNIETEGGWPYIERMNVQKLLRNLVVMENDSDNA